MESFKFFSSFYHLSDLKFREDLIKGIIENLDYTVLVLLRCLPIQVPHTFTEMAIRELSCPKH